MAGLVTGQSIVNPDEKLAGAGINVVVERATKVDAGKKKVFLSRGGEVPYDKLILATGASPFVPPIEGRDLKGVFILRTLQDAEGILGFLSDKGPRKLVFVGSGFISIPAPPP